MSLLQRGRRLLTVLVLTGLLVITTACGGVSQVDRTSSSPALPSSSLAYQQLERGNTSSGQSFGDWVLSTARGLVSDAFVRDDNKLGAVITPQVRPSEVRSLARSLMQGFHQSFPDRDLAVLMYAPDRKLILTARYNQATNQIEYQ